MKHKWDWAGNIGRKRYQAKVDANISLKRKDGSTIEEEVFRQATAAEAFGVFLVGQSLNEDILIHGDPGYDCLLNLQVEIIHLGFAKNGKPRKKDDWFVIVDPKQKWRWANIYIAIAGSIETDFRCAGWTTHSKLVTYPMKDFGWGKRYAQPTDKLYNIKTLQELCWLPS